MLELWWLGQAGFRLRDPAAGRVVFCDPFLTASDRRAGRRPSTPPPWRRPTWCWSRTSTATTSIARRLQAAAARPGSRFTLVVPRPLVAELPTSSACRKSDWSAPSPARLIELDGVRVHPVPARHGVNVADAYTFGEELSNGLVRYLGYVVDIGGVRVYHAGDCSPVPRPGRAAARARARTWRCCRSTAATSSARPRANIVGNMDFREAARLAHDVGVELLVPMHWELFASNRGYPGDLLAYVETTFPDLSVLVHGPRQRASPSDRQPTR